MCSLSMVSFYEIDFLEAGDDGSGDAIAARYKDDSGEIFIHVIDGGYTDDGQKLIEHIGQYYGRPIYIDHVMLTHPDGDHAAGLKKILEDVQVGTLWMNRPWNHLDELLPRYKYEYTREGLRQRLRRDFKHTAALEDIAEEQGIVIRDVFQGQQIGCFTALAPSFPRYIDLVVASEKTPEPKRKALIEGSVFRKAISFVRRAVASWGDENLKGDTEGTSAENEMSVIQYANVCGDEILLTGDGGVQALGEAYDYAISIGISLPGLDKFQVPHHGSRRNLSSDILDKWLGPKLTEIANPPLCAAIVSANTNDEDHPRDATVRAVIHRGATVTKTRGTICFSQNAPEREGWWPAPSLDYPETMEE